MAPKFHFIGPKPHRFWQLPIRRRPRFVVSYIEKEHPSPVIDLVLGSFGRDP
jgi:hypothetical protein